MNRPIGPTIPVSNFRKMYPPEDEITQGADNLLGGVQPDIPARHIPNNALAELENAIYLRSRLYRYNAPELFTPAKPDSNAVIGIFPVYTDLDGLNLIRVTTTKLYRLSSTGWVEITGAGLATNSSALSNIIVADGRVFFSNGADIIQEIDLATDTYAPLGNAPAYFYITSAYNRIIGANISGLPYRIGWSGDLNYDQWDGTVDISAGSTDLVDSPADLLDAITGLFNFPNGIAVVRERSIWSGTNRPSATTPFFFRIELPGIGCDTPRTLAKTDVGIVFYSFVQATVYYYEFGKDILDISSPIKRELKSRIANASRLFGSYNADVDCYSLFIASDNTDTIYCYTYHFETKAWSKQQDTKTNYCSDIIYDSTTGMAIDGLTGTIDDLAGTIDSIGGITARSSRFLGYLDGEIRSVLFYDTVSIATITDNTLTTSYSFKELAFAVQSAYKTKLHIELTPYTEGTFTIYYNKDGNGWTEFKTVTISADDLDKSKLIMANKQIYCRSIQWKITTSDVMHSLDSYEVVAIPSGVSRR